VAVAGWGMDQVGGLGVRRRREGHSLVVTKVVEFAEWMMGDWYMIETYLFLKLHVLTVMTAAEAGVALVATPAPPQMSVAWAPLATLSLLFQALSQRPAWQKGAAVVGLDMLLLD
jgi:hypothetical protein